MSRAKPKILPSASAMLAPYFCIQVNDEGAAVSRPFPTLDEALDTAQTGFGVTTYAVGTIAQFDRTHVTPEELNAAAMELLIEITAHRDTSCPQNLPVALYRKAQHLVQQRRK